MTIIEKQKYAFYFPVKIQSKSLVLRKLKIISTFEKINVFTNID